MPENIIFSFSMEEKGIFGLIGSQLLQTRAIPLKSGEMHDLMLPLLVPRYLGDPTLGTALLLVKCCPTSEVFSVVF